MHRPLTLFISLRYMTGRGSGRFGYLVTWLAIIGLAIGVTVLITVLSVMNGLEDKLEKRTLGFMPQALITSSSGSIDPKKEPINSLHLLGVNRIEPLTIGEVVIQSSCHIGVATVLGINPNKSDILEPFLINVRQTELQAGKYNLIVGEKLAKQLGLNPGEQVRLLVPTISYLTPFGFMPSQRLFNVIGTFFSNSDADNYQVLVNQQDASRLMLYRRGYITGWRLWLKKPLEVEKISAQSLPGGLVWKDWRDQKGALFQAVHMEKNIMGLLLSLIILVSAFNIVTSLFLLIMEKRSEVAILQTQGLQRRKITMIFIIQGSIVGFAGSLIGAFLGVFLTTQLGHLMEILGIFMDKMVTLPTVISISQVVFVTLSANLVAFVAALLPSFRASSLSPVEALRYE
ncbi:lipoprotein-releasing ABC transporter permease subunit LolC [Candidatus Erwinia haradaeae]|uniref:Lipoprotein-releasing system transmembrane protein LolC n=1 Tax=Candidatus Erwinia haradaeae TaxID=1922217 RepID=A0A803GD26_9GAMM|nr:lipoprotein-releasing ABC transporter permease subunit LolC [Candidatus Erwinia haradaeae]VFP88621.1 Lipoprotein-releasing system transmembrane protein LolC [Candidatus Erwinia haradaeae]